MRILIAPSGFKESLGADEVALAIENGLLRVEPTAEIRRLPVVDGGEGFTRGVVEAVGGRIHAVEVTGPVGEPVLAHFGTLDGTRTAVLEMASAAGLRLVPRDHRDPGRTTTRGVGELIRAALDSGADHLLVGCGDSGTNDGGAGMAAALGARFLDAAGRQLDPVGDTLHRVDRIDVSHLDSRLAGVSVEVACNPFNVLLGERGVARVFGPQKGASQNDVERLARGLDRYAEVIVRDLGRAIGNLPGSGASGGLGAGLLAFLGARLYPRFELVSRFLDLDGAIAGADLVITAEGSLDHQTPNGKVPGEIARRARERGIPVLALAGTLGPGAGDVHSSGVDAFMGILPRPCELPEAIDQAAVWLADAAEQAMRFTRVGRRMAEQVAAPI